MSREQFHGQLLTLEQDIVELAVQVRSIVTRAVDALAHLDTEAARGIVAGDKVIDDREHELEGECLRLIALQQPIAGDLRAIGAALRILIDLERIADHGSDIARTAIRLSSAGEKLMKPLIDIPRMAQLALEMVTRALDAYVERDAMKARALVSLDDQVDHLFSQVFRELLVLMMADPKTINQGAELMFVASHLERVADHATNLAEAIIYAVTGERLELND